MHQQPCRHSPSSNRRGAREEACMHARICVSIIRARNHDFAPPTFPSWYTVMSRIIWRQILPHLFSSSLLLVDAFSSPAPVRLDVYQGGTDADRTLLPVGCFGDLKLCHAGHHRGLQDVQRCDAHCVLSQAQPDLYALRHRLYNQLAFTVACVYLCSGTERLWQIEHLRR